MSIQERARGNDIPTKKEQAFQQPVFDLRIGFPLRSTVPSCVNSLTTLPSSMLTFFEGEQKSRARTSNIACFPKPSCTQF